MSVKNELVTCRISAFIVAMAKYPRLRKISIKLAKLLECGELHSKSLREIYQRHYGITVGAHSYGSCFRPSNFALGTSVGRYTSIAEDVKQVFDHPMQGLTMHPYFYNKRLGVVDTDQIKRNPVHIGHDVWIGEGVRITQGCKKIGIGAVIGVGSVVTKDVPDFTVVAGCPAKKIRDRFSPEVQHQIMQTKWWDFELNKLAKYKELMVEPIDITSDTFNHFDRK